MSESDFFVLSALEALYDEVSPYAFYREIFPVDELEKRGIYEKGKYHAVAVAIPPNGDRTKRYTITDDLEKLEELTQTDDFCIMSPISYAGTSRKSENARFMYAMAIDLDGVDTLDRWDYLLAQIEYGKEPFGVPAPTFLVSSGTGLHLYYVFERPIPMFPNIVEQLEVLKKRLTWQAWTQGASSLHDAVQYESLFQGFRIVGTITKHGDRCRAFRSGKKVTIEYLNQLVPERFRATKFVYKSNLLLKDAKEKYPDWYQRRVVEKQPPKHWTCNKALYDWWLWRADEVQEGHRYWFIFFLTAYAVKCGVSLEKLEEDAYGLVSELSARGKEPFTSDDVLHALEAYNDSSVTYPIETISNRTGLNIKRNEKRKCRPQKLHLKLARANRDILCAERGKTDWREGAGRPTEELTVLEWRAAHPDGRKIDCEHETGLSRHTVLKWWNNYNDFEKELLKSVPQ